MLSNDPLATPMIKGHTMAWWLLRTDHGRSWTMAAGSIVARWLERGRSRRVLATLDDHQLRDIGISRADALLESERPFWRP
jgi:uncharacterized protein YjiS (DUF1127 family)